MSYITEAFHNLGGTDKVNLNEFNLSNSYFDMAKRRRMGSEETNDEKYAREEGYLTILDDLTRKYGYDEVLHAVMVNSDDIEGTVLKAQKELEGKDKKFESMKTPISEAGAAVDLRDVDQETADLFDDITSDGDFYRACLRSDGWDETYKIVDRFAEAQYGEDAIRNVADMIEQNFEDLWHGPRGKQVEFVTDVFNDLCARYGKEKLFDSVINAMDAKAFIETVLHVADDIDPVSNYYY